MAGHLDVVKRQVEEAKGASCSTTTTTTTTTPSLSFLPFSVQLRLKCTMSLCCGLDEAVFHYERAGWHGYTTGRRLYLCF